MRSGIQRGKHDKHALAQTLRLELRGQPLRRVEIAPGMVKASHFPLNRFPCVTSFTIPHAVERTHASVPAPGAGGHEWPAQGCL